VERTVSSKMGRAHIERDPPHFCCLLIWLHPFPSPLPLPPIFYQFSQVGVTCDTERREGSREAMKVLKGRREGAK
jgi:hypothetical protein